LNATQPRNDICPQNNSVSRLITIIDDDSDDIELLQSAILKADPSVKFTVFTSPQEALVCISTDKIPPDMIFIDYKMPVFNGIECLQLFNALRILNYTPYIASSNLMSPELAQAFIDQGASYVFEKPTSIEGYERVVEHVFTNIFGEVKSPTYNN
jgi:CheY-like chemotaxis protein